MNISRTLLMLMLVLGTTGLLSAQIEVNIEDASADNGQTVALNVSVNNFDSIVSYQFSVLWDSTVLEFQSVENLNSQLGLVMDDFATPGDLGQANGMSHIWLTPDMAGETLPDGSVLFTVNFSVIGDPCDESDVALSNEFSVISFTDNDGMELAVTANNGTVDVTPCMTGGGDIVLTASMESGENGDTVCVQVTADGFSEIFSAQWSHSYSPSVLNFVELRNFGLEGLDAGLFSVDETNGTISMSYLPPGGETETVPDGTILYEICFEIIGSSGQMSGIPFTNDPAPLEVVQVQNGSPVEVGPDTNAGKVTVTGDFDGLTISLPDVQAAPGDTVCVPLLFENVDDLQGLQDITINWDPEVLNFIQTQNREAPGSGYQANETNVANGIYFFVYFFVDNQGNGWSTPSANFIEFCFEVVGDCEDTSPLNISDDLFVVNSASEFIPYVVEDGSFTVDCANCEADPLISNVSCGQSDDGSIDLQLSNCPDITAVEWSDAGIPDGTQNATGLEAGSYSVTVTYNGGTDEAIFDNLIVGDDNISLQSVDVSDCTSGSNGMIDITVAGGSGNYDFEWSNGATTEDISGVNCGAHSVTVSDADNPGCDEVFGPFDVPCPISVEPSVSDVSCTGEDDGSIDLSVSGGTGDYSFNWDPDVGNGSSLDGLAPGSYDLTITDENNCTFESSYTISEPDALVIDDVTIDDDIMGEGEGQISISVSGGTGDIDIEWSNGESGATISGLGCGTYTVTVTDENDCTVEDSYDVDGIEVSADITNIGCFGENSGAIDISIICGQGGFSYTWSDEDGTTDQDLVNVEAGSYTVSITSDNGNMLVRTFQVEGPAAALSATVQVDEENCPDDASAAVVVSGGTEPYDIQWNTIPPQSGPIANGLGSGTYIAFIEDANGCEIMVQAEIQCAPPVPCDEAIPIITPNGDGLNDEFIISCAPLMDNTLRIFTRWGQEVFTVSNYQNDWTGVDDDGEPLENGTYLWVLEVIETDGDTRIVRGTVTVQRDIN